MCLPRTITTTTQLTSQVTSRHITAEIHSRSRLHSISPRIPSWGSAGGEIKSLPKVHFIFIACPLTSVVIDRAGAGWAGQQRLGCSSQNVCLATVLCCPQPSTDTRLAGQHHHTTPGYVETVISHLWLHSQTTLQDYCLSQIKSFPVCLSHLILKY